MKPGSLGILVMPSSGRTSLGLPVHDPRLERLFGARFLMERSVDQSLGLAPLARSASMSPFHFLRLFRVTFGQTPHQFAMSVRIERAKLLLTETTLSITAVCAAVGYDSLGSFSALFRREVGQTPKDYRARRRRFWTIGAELPRRFVPGCFLTMFDVAAEKQFSRRNPSGEPDILAEKIPAAHS